MSGCLLLAGRGEKVDEGEDQFVLGGG